MAAENKGSLDLISRPHRARHGGTRRMSQASLSSARQVVHHRGPDLLAYLQTSQTGLHALNHT
jgi:hypothetical protein